MVLNWKTVCPFFSFSVWAGHTEFCFQGDRFTFFLTDFLNFDRKFSVSVSENVNKTAKLTVFSSEKTFFQCQEFSAR